MRRKLLVLLMVIVVLSCCVIFASCGTRRITTYYPEVPLDLEYSGSLTNVLEVEQSDHTDITTITCAVAQKYETVAGENRFVTYIEYREIGNWGSQQADTLKTYLHIGDKTFELEGNAWVPSTTTMFFTYEDVYVNLANYSDSYRSLMTNDLFGRDLNEKYRVETTDKYIKYVCQDEETFVISNDKYNVILGYYYDTKLGSKESQTATFDVGSTMVPHLKADGSVGGDPTEHVPYLNTITPSML